MIFSKIANFTSEIRRFGQVYTGYFYGETLYLILDMSRNIGQPVKFYFRGGARDPPLTAKLIGSHVLLPSSGFDQIKENSFFVN